MFEFRLIKKCLVPLVLLLIVTLISAAKAYLSDDKKKVSVETGAEREKSTRKSGAFGTIIFFCGPNLKKERQRQVLHYRCGYCRLEA